MNGPASRSTTRRAIHGLSQPPVVRRAGAPMRLLHIDLSNTSVVLHHFKSGMAEK